MNTLPLAPASGAAVSPDFKTNDECPICLDAFGNHTVNVVEGRCGHRYDLGCIATWFSKNIEQRKCVLCRRDTQPLTYESGVQVPERLLCIYSLSLQAVHTGNAELLRKMLDSDPSIAHQTYPSAMSPYEVDLLSIAIEHGQVECVKALVPFAVGTINEPRCTRGETALFIAARNGDTRCVEALIEAGADVTVPSRSASPLLIALKHGHVECAKQLMAAGGDINNCFVENNYLYRYQIDTALHHAVRKCDVTLLKAALAVGADVNRPSAVDSLTPVMIAAKTIRPDIMQILLNHGANVNARSEGDSFTALMLAAEQGDVDSVQLLLDHGADPNLCMTGQCEGRTALHFAAEGDKLGECIEKLLAAGADPNAALSDGSTPLMLAASKKRDFNIRVLVEGGADVNAKNHKGVAPLHICARHRLFERVEMLLAAGADCDIQTHEGVTPLIISAQQGDLRMLQALWSAGANVNAIAHRRGINDGSTALHLAAACNHPKFVEQLLSYGVDVNAVRESDGSTPLHRAALFGHLECVKALIRAGATVTAKDNDGLTPEDLATQHQHRETRKALANTQKRWWWQKKL